MYSSEIIENWDSHSEQKSAMSGKLGGKNPQSTVEHSVSFCQIVCQNHRKISFIRINFMDVCMDM